MKTAILGLLTLLAACSPADRSVADFAADRAAAEAVVTDCDAGRQRSDCDAARRGLVEAKRCDRMDAYRRAL